MEGLALEISEVQLEEAKHPDTLIDASHSSSAPVSNHVGQKAGQHARLAMLSAYAFARWGGRCWEFSIALFLVELDSSSLLFTAVYGLLEDVLRLTSGSVVGRYIDRTDRLGAATRMCLLQNMGLALSAAAAAVALGMNTAAHQEVVRQLLASFTVVLGSIGSVGSLGLQASLEADWPKVMCEGDSQALTNMNSVLRGIDMVCMLLGPLAASLLMQFAGMLPAAVLLLLWNLLGSVPETMLMRMAYRDSPNLRRPKAIAEGDASPSANPDPDPKSAAATASLSPREPHPTNPTSSTNPTQTSPSLSSQLAQKWRNFSSGWHIYAQQRVLLACMALALLYCTVLSLGYLMTGYIKMRGMGEAQISVFRGVGAVTGLMATLVFPRLAPRIGLHNCGLLGIYWQLVWLALGTLPSLLSHLGVLPAALNTPLLYLLLLGLAMSRFGLWLFDLAVSQLMQEEVPESQLGSVSAIQSSLSSGMELLMFGVCIIAPRTSQFPALMLASVLVVLGSVICFSLYCSRSGEPQYRPVPLTPETEG